MLNDDGHHTVRVHALREDLWENLAVLGVPLLRTGRVPA